MLNHKRDTCSRCMNRRRFLTLAVAVACDPIGLVEAAGEQMIDAGPLHDYAADGLYSKYMDLGFFIVRKGEKLFVLSSICTHKKCKLTPESDRSFSCECHGSTFDRTGKVTQGPANRDLPVIDSFVNASGHFIVKLS